MDITTGETEIWEVDMLLTSTFTSMTIMTLSGKGGSEKKRMAESLKLKTLSLHHLRELRNDLGDPSKRSKSNFSTSSAVCLTHLSSI